MPKLEIFVPCERVIIGQGDNSASIIVVIQQLEFRNLNESPDVPENVGVLVRLSIFTQWRKLPSDEDKTYEQKYTFGRPGEKKTILEAMAPEFQMTQKSHRITVTLEALPLLEAGEFVLGLWLKEKALANWPSHPVAEYSLDIVHSSNAVVKR
jgi:hypothetical protein